MLGPGLLLCLCFRQQKLCVQHLASGAFILMHAMLPACLSERLCTIPTLSA